jgi:signal transduction histidine kinase
VYNLLDNAIKFINPDGTLTLRTEKRDGRVYCSVRNTGVGISAQEMPRIFERFYKEDSFTQGAGLGLSICQTIVDRLHGSISVSSELGKGTRFEVVIPDANE